ncbi:MAG: glycoside hydrolase family 113, partial [Solirubrobacterales bacterium]
MRKVSIVVGAVIALLAVGGIGYALGTSSEKDEPAIVETPGVPATGTTGPTETGDTAEPATTTVTAGDPLNGLNLTAYTPDGYGMMNAREDIQLLKNVGSNSVTIVPTWYVKNSSANEIKPNKKKTPSDESLGKIISWAQQADLKVILKPHVDSMDSTFRGDLQPADRTKWFSSYGNFIGHYAGLAANNGADTFVIGTELRSLSSDTDPWKKVAQDVRAKFGGQLTYAANWDEV